MTDDATEKAATAGDHRRSGRWLTMPVALLVLGLLAIATLLWMSALNKEQLAHYALADALERIHTETTMAHLWFEEALAGDQSADFVLAWASMAEAERLSRVILQGGKVRSNLLLPVPRDRNLIAAVEAVSGLLSEFEAIAKQRYAHPETAGLGSELDQRFDNVHKEISSRTFVLEDAAGKTLRSGNVMVTRLFRGVIIAWLFIIVTATALLWNHEAKWQRAEEDLQDAKGELEVRVVERTRELQVTNEQLSRELTARKQAEAEKDILRKEAERAAHLAALGELAAGVAHEINNPVSGIIGCAEILANKTAPGSREHDLGRRILKEGDRIAFITQSLLSFAREEPGEKVPVPVGEILADLLTLTEAQLRKEGITLRVDIDDEALIISAQPQRLEQVFLNIINNARDALNQKYPEKVEEKALSITAKRTLANGRPLVRIAFHDRGAGIPEQVLNKVKNPFFSTKPKGKGTGLGLSISQGIVADCGGKLTVDSVEGAFTEVAVELPLLDAG